MSDETQANPLFAPFKPTTEQPMPFEPAPETPPKNGRKHGRKGRGRKPQGAISAQPSKRKPKPPKQPAIPAATDTPAKLGLQTILGACAGLKQEDFCMFDMLFNMAKPQRERIMAAIGKVFA